MSIVRYWFKILPAMLLGLWVYWNRFYWFFGRRSEVLASEAVTCLNKALYHLKDIWEEIGIPEDQRLQRTNVVKNHVKVRHRLTHGVFKRDAFCRFRWGWMGGSFTLIVSISNDQWKNPWDHWWTKLNDIWCVLMICNTRDLGRES